MEDIGFYNPASKAMSAKAERVSYWMEKGAKPTPTVHNLLVANKILKAESVVKKVRKEKKEGKK